MSNGMNKDWLDALREKGLPEGATPSPASWEVVGRRVRRAAAIRRAGLTAAALVPVAALLLWAPWHRPAQLVPAGPAVTQVAPAPDTTAAPAPVVPEAAPATPNQTPRSHKLTISAGGTQLAAADPAVSVPAGTDLPDDTPVVVGYGLGTHDPSPTVTSDAAPVTPAAPVILSASEESASDEPFDESVFFEDARPQRARVSFGVRGGAALARRQSDIDMVKYPTLLALNLANSLDPELLDYVKSNSGGDLYGYFLSNGMINYGSYGSVHDAYGGPHFRHDLPLTLGLSVRADLTPRIGLESGLEYSYLHSVESLGSESLDQRLHFIGIPVRADVRLWSGERFSLYAGLGGKVEKCVYAILGHVRSDEKKLQWSSELFAGAQYRLGPRVQLYFQPELSYYFTRTELATSRTENPLSVSLHAGLRFEL